MNEANTYLAVLALSLVGCAHDPDWYEIRNHAIEMRLDVNAVVEDIEPNAVLIDAACAVRGRDSTECKLLGSMWEAARATISASQRAIDLYDATGIGLASAQKAIERVREAADRFTTAVERVGEVVTNAVAQNARQGAQGDRDGDRARATEGEGTAPAAAGAEPIAAPPGTGIP